MSWSKEKQREYMRIYNASAKAKEKVKTYNASPKGLARKQRYAATVKGESTEQRYWERRAGGFVLLESHRTDVIDLQMLLGRQLTSSEMDWWAICCWTGYDRFLKFRNERAA